jgi:endonuclease YncB( thermonuclease family)
MKKNPNRDRFGALKTAQAGKINAAITTRPTTFETVAKKVGVDVTRVRNHVNYWLKKGKIPFVVDGDKVAVEPAKKETPAAQETV